MPTPVTEDAALDFRPTCLEKVHATAATTDVAILAALRELASCSGQTGLRLLSPSTAEFLVQFHQVPAMRPDPSWDSVEGVLCIFLSEQHWTCLTVAFTPAGVQALCLDGVLGRNTNVARHLAGQLAGLKAVGLTFFRRTAGSVRWKLVLVD